MSLFGFAQAADHNVFVVGGQNSTPRSTLHLQRSFFYFLFFSYLFETGRKARIAVGQLRNGFRKRSGSGTQHHTAYGAQYACPREQAAEGKWKQRYRVSGCATWRQPSVHAAARAGRVLVAIVVFFWGLSSFFFCPARGYIVTTLHSRV